MIYETNPRHWILQSQASWMNNCCGSDQSIEMSEERGNRRKQKLKANFGIIMKKKKRTQQRCGRMGKGNTSITPRVFSVHASPVTTKRTVT